MKPATHRRAVEIATAAQTIPAAALLAACAIPSAPAWTISLAFFSYLATFVAGQILAATEPRATTNH